MLSLLENKSIDDLDLRLHFDQANEWDEKLLCTAFSFARIIERRCDSKEKAQSMINKLFSMPNQMYFDIQECGEDFVDYMLRHEHVGNTDLETSLMAVARKLSEHNYGKKTLRD